MAPPLPYLTVPLVGGVIGYVTNYVAIRMLFRPLRPWRIFGLRLPLTPGVIPARRHQLAENIGHMVGEHLLTADDIRRGLAAEPFQAELTALVEQRLAEILDRPLPPLPELVPARFRPAFDSGVRILRRRAFKLLALHLESDGFGQRLQATVAEGCQALLSRPCGRLLDGEAEDNLAEFAGRLVQGFFTGEAGRALVRKMVAAGRQGLEAEERSLGQLLGAEASRSLEDFACSLVPRLLEWLADILHQPPVRRQMAQRLAKAAAGFLGNLGPLAGFLQGLLDPDEVAERIDAYLAEHGEAITAWILDPATRSHLEEVTRQRLAAALAQPPHRFMDWLGRERLDEVEGWLAGRLHHWLAQPAFAEMVARAVADGLAAQRERTVGEVASGVAGDRLATMANWLAAETLAACRSRRFRQLVEESAITLLEGPLYRQPLGRLRDFLPRSVQQSLGGWLQQQINLLLEREVVRLVAGLDLQGLVTRKVDGLDLLRLEELLLSIMREHFTYINLFGGLLGLLIGLANLALLG